MHAFVGKKDDISLLDCHRWAFKSIHLGRQHLLLVCCQILWLLLLLILVLRGAILRTLGSPSFVQSQKRSIIQVERAVKVKRRHFMSPSRCSVLRWHAQPRFLLCDRRVGWLHRGKGTIVFESQWRHDYLGLRVASSNSVLEIVSLRADGALALWLLMLLRRSLGPVPNLVFEIWIRLSLTRRHSLLQKLLCSWEHNERI